MVLSPLHLLLPPPDFLQLDGLFCPWGPPSELVDQGDSDEEDGAADGCYHPSDHIHLKKFDGHILFLGIFSQNCRQAFTKFLWP